MRLLQDIDLPQLNQGFPCVAAGALSATRQRQYRSALWRRQNHALSDTLPTRPSLRKTREPTPRRVYCVRAAKIRSSSKRPQAPFWRLLETCGARRSPVFEPSSQIRGPTDLERELSRLSRAAKTSQDLLYALSTHRKITTQSPVAATGRKPDRKRRYLISEIGSFPLLSQLCGTPSRASGCAIERCYPRFSGVRRRRRYIRSARGRRRQTAADAIRFMHSPSIKYDQISTRSRSPPAFSCFSCPACK